EPFAGRGYGGGDEYGDSTLSSIDREVRTLIDSAHADAYWALTRNRDVLDNLAYQLLERETLDQAALAAIFADVTKRPVREVWLAHDDRPVSERGPITPPTSQSDRNTGEGSGGAEVDTTDLPGAGPSGVRGPNVPHNPPGPQNPNDPGASGPGGPSTMGDVGGQNTNGLDDERGNDIRWPISKRSPPVSAPPPQGVRTRSTTTASPPPCARSASPCGRTQTEKDSSNTPTGSRETM